MPRKTVAKGYLGIKPAVRVACRTRTEQVVFIEYTFIEPTAFRQTGFVGGFKVLNRVKQINTKMKTCRKLSDDELGLQADTQTPAVGTVGTSRSQIGFIKIGTAIDIRPIVEHVHSPTQPEDLVRTPISSKLHFAGEESLLVPIIDLPAACRESELQFPTFLEFGFPRSCRLYIMLRGIAHAYVARKHIVARIGLHHTAIADMVPPRRNRNTPPMADRKLHIKCFGEIEIEYAADALVGIIQVLEEVFLRDGIAIGLSNECGTYPRTESKDKMRETHKRNIHKSVWRNGTTKERLITQIPIADRHTERGIIPIMQGTPIGAKSHSELTAHRRAHPLPFLSEHIVHFAIGHDCPRPKRQTIVGIQRK